MSLPAELAQQHRSGPEAPLGPYPPEQIEKLRQRAAAMAHRWAAEYPSPWALDSEIEEAARAWSVEGAREVVRHLESPRAALLLTAWGTVAVGAANLACTGAVAVSSSHGPLFVLPLASAGGLVLIRGLELLARHHGVRRQHRAGIPPLRARLQTELETAAIAALDARRTRLAGPRRPIPKHTFEEFSPLQAQQVAAAWMRHLGELDASVLKVDEDDPSPSIHIVSSGYIGRAWPFDAPVPEREMRILESASRRSGRRPLLFARGSFPDPLVARADRLGVGLFLIDPWAATIRSANLIAARHLKRGLRDADGLVSSAPRSRTLDVAQREVPARSPGPSAVPSRQR